MKTYQVSVVTPFHNVNMEMFLVCAASMRAQTIGFENIQWIIVVHNCEAGYMEQLTEMFKDDTNVLIKELNDEHKTPSSPRNHGTEVVTAPYVGYLDADDSYLPDCLEVAIREAIDTRSQMVWFRREVEKEHPSMIMPMATTSWNNTFNRIIVEHGKWEDEKMFEGLFGFATSYIYETEFLRSHHLTFSTTMHFGEDFLFVVETSAQAHRICYLPQHIGYHYFVNSSSMVQKGEKTAQQLIKYAEGFHHLFETMRNYGIDEQENAQIQCGIVMARFILQTTSLTFKDRQTIKDILGEDVSSMIMLPPNKTFDKKARALMYHMSRDVILNPQNPGALMLRIITDGIHKLIPILRENADTDMGLRYHFRKLNSFAAYQNRIPLTNGEFYKPLIRLQTQVGERNILTSAPIKRYFIDEKGYYIPCTTKNAIKYAEYFASLLKGKNNLLVARSLPILGIANDGAEIDTMKSAITKDYFSSCFYQGGIQQAKVASDIRTYFKQDNTTDDYFDIICDALSATDINQIVGFTTVELLKAFNTLEKRWQEMTEHIADPVRRQEVVRILSEGFDNPVAARLWPNLEKVIAYGTGELYYSFVDLKRYTAGITHNHGYYFLEESIMGKAVADDTELFISIQDEDNDFYELQSVLDETVIQTWSKVEVGQRYFLIVTNSSGLYRYQTDHIISPQEITPETVKFMIY